MKVNDRIKAARHLAGLTVEEAAAQCGVSISTFRKWEAPNTGRLPKDYSLDGILLRLLAVTSKAAENLLKKLRAHPCPSCRKPYDPEENPDACPHCGQSTFFAVSE